MNDHNRDFAANWAIIATFSVLAFWIGRWITTNQIRQDAVEHNAAQWMVDSKGNSEFTWRDEQ